MAHQPLLIFSINSSLTPFNFRRKRAWYALLWCLAWAPILVHAQWFETEQAIMGTVVKVELWHTDANYARSSMDAVMDEMHRVDRKMSPFKPESELSLINKAAAQHPVSISKELFWLIQRSLEISKLSQGAFDITFASVGYLYDYRKGIKPSDETIKQTLQAINYKHIILDPARQTIFFAKQGVRIDLGGIAKGYAVDQGIDILKKRGIREALVSAGGDSRVLGDKRGRPWMIGIRHPRKGIKDAPIVALPLSNTALSTSGDYERYFERDGERHHHIISPKTGKSVSATRSVTVIGPDATTTDALSTTLFVLGPEKALRLAESLKEIDAVIIDAKGKMHYTTGLAPP